MAAINQPNRAPGQMDAISAVLNIGSTLYGIKANQDKAKQDQADSVLNNKVKEAQLSVANQDLADKARKSKGQYTPNEIASLAVEKDFTVSDSPLAQAIKLTQVGPDGQAKDVYLAKRVDQGKTLDYQNKKLQNQKLGEEIAKIKNESGKDKGYNSLDTLTKEQAKTIAQSNAKILVVKNGIDAGLAQLQSDKLSEEAKIKVGQSMLKILNSAEGVDAVGVDEAKRLGSYLEYKIANVTEPGSFVGRDLNLFTDQVANKSNELAERIKNNETAIKGLMSGQSISALADNGAGSNKKKETKSVFSEAVAGSDKAPKFDPSKPFKVVK